MTTRRAMIGANSIQAGGRDKWYATVGGQGSGRARRPPGRERPRLGRGPALPCESWRNDLLLIRRAAGAAVLLLDLGLDVVDRLADGLDLLGLLVRDGDLELLLQLHDQL